MMDRKISYNVVIRASTTMICFLLVVLRLDEIIRRMNIKNIEIKKGLIIVLGIISALWAGYLVYDIIQVVTIPDHEFATEGIIFLSSSLVALIIGIVAMNNQEESSESVEDSKPKKKVFKILFATLLVIAMVAGIVSAILVI